MHGKDQHRTGAIVLIRFGLDRIGNDCAVAPGRCATHNTTPIIQLMPSPIRRQNTASKPSGSVSTPRMPMGMIQKETTGIASTLASTP